jgi:hypothetical protein
MMTKRGVTMLCALALACGAAAAQDEPVQSVKVDGIKDPEMRSYRSVRAGFETFDDNHALAPKVAELSFHMYPRSSAGRANMEGLALRIAGDGESTMVPIAPNGTFSLPRLTGADDADLILNRKKGMFRGRPEIRTPGLPDNVRRLGDLRLECKVMVEMAKTEIPFWVKAMVNTVLLSGDWCGARKDMQWSFTSATELAGAAMKDGERTLKIGTSGWQFTVPIGDPAWPDDALIELSYK